MGRPEKLKSQTEKVEFKTLASEQNRQLFLECEIDSEFFGKVTDIVDVTVAYQDSTEGDSGIAVAEAPQTVTISYTKDEKLAEKKRDQEISAQAAIYANAEETERAISLADKGDFAGYRDQLGRQAATLRSKLSAAPAAQKAELEAEIDAVEEAQSDLDKNNALSKSQRKKLQSGAFELRNAKR